MDDCSDDSTPEKLRSFSNVSSLMVISADKRRGSFASRNLGARHAQGGILVFTDADCIASRNWLDRICSPIVSGEFKAVQGAFNIPTKHGFWVDLECLLLRLYDNVDTKNFALLKKVFWQLGGFDDFFSGGDADLGLRMRSQKVSVKNEPLAVVFHYWPNSLLTLLEKHYIYFIGQLRILLKYSIIRENTRLSRKDRTVKILKSVLKIPFIVAKASKQALGVDAPLPRRLLFALYFSLIRVCDEIFLTSYTIRSS